MLLIVVGAVIVGGAAFVLSPQLVTDHFVACGVAVGDDGFSCQANHSTILGVRLSDREYVVWGTILGGVVGALLGLTVGLVLGRATRRE